jgi:hypothetical protein
MHSMKNEKRHHPSDPSEAGACLDVAKLENHRIRADGANIARCPACATAGGDRRGEHLIIFPDGKFGCVANPGDREHRKAIFRLVGIRRFRKRPVSPPCGSNLTFTPIV